MNQNKPNQPTQNPGMKPGRTDRPGQQQTGGGGGSQQQQQRKPSQGQGQSQGQNQGSFGQRQDRGIDEEL